MAPAWPWPGDSREDRAKRIALSYRRALEAVAREYPRAAEKLSDLDDHWCEVGQGWLRPTNAPLRLEDWLTAIEIADLFNQAPKTIYDWGRRGRIRTITNNAGDRLYCVGDVVEYARNRRHCRARAAPATRASYVD